MVQSSCNESFLFVDNRFRVIAIHLLTLQVLVPVWPFNLTQFFS